MTSFSTAHIRSTLSSILICVISGVFSLEADAQESGIGRVGGTIHEYLVANSVTPMLSAEDLAVLPISVRRQNDLLSKLDSVGINTQMSRPAFRTPSLGNVFFSDGFNAFSISADNFSLYVNPITNLQLGQYRNISDSESRMTGTYWNTHRGIRLSGTLGKNWYFDSRLTEIQERVIDSSQLRFGTLPRQRIVRFNPECARESCSADEAGNENVYDYGPVFGTVGYETERMSVRIGRERLRLGYASNSLFLSGYASEFDHILLRLNYKKFTYTYILASMFDPSDRSAAGTPRRKTMVIHRYAFQVGSRLNIAAFDAMIISADTSAGFGGGIELGLLNPLLFLRQVEKDFNAFGNKLFGLEADWRVSNRGRLYGQLLLDEFVSSEIFSGSGFWANKWGVLAGVLIANPFQISGYIRLEYARVRPYTYSHKQAASSYTHYGDPLGHPAGANFDDLMVKGYFRLSRSISADVIVSYTRSGTDIDGTNYGDDPTVSYSTRPSDYGVSQFQGVRSNNWIGDGRVSVELIPSLFFDLQGSMVLTDTDNSRVRERLVVKLGLRWNSEPFSTRN